MITILRRCFGKADFALCVKNILQRVDDRIEFTGGNRVVFRLRRSGTTDNNSVYGDASRQDHARKQNAETKEKPFFHTMYVYLRVLYVRKGKVRKFRFR